MLKGRSARRAAMLAVCALGALGYPPRVGAQSTASPIETPRKVEGHPFPAGKKITRFYLDPSGKRAFAASSGLDIVAEYDGRGWRTHRMPQSSVSAMTMAGSDRLLVGNGFRPARAVVLDLRSGRTEPTNLTANMKIGGVAQARSGDLVAVTCFTGEAWTSRDGVRWQNQGRLGGYQALWFLEADPKTGYLYTGGEGEEGIYESRDDGRTWTSLGLRHGEGYRGNSTAAVFNGRGELIVARGGRRAYLHRRVGDRWEPSSKGVPMRPPVFGLERINGVLILSCGGKIYTSVDEGESWQSGAQEIAARIERIGPGPGGTLLMFSLDGLYEAKVRGASR